MNDGPRMLRYDVMTHAMSDVFNVEQPCSAATASSGRCTRATTTTCTPRPCKDSSLVRDARLHRLRRGIRRAHVLSPQKGDFDECQIDKSGRWLLDQGERRRPERRGQPHHRSADRRREVFLDENGAAGHSDLGYGYMVAEDNFNHAPGAVRVWQLGRTSGQRPGSRRRPGHAGLRDWPTGRRGIGHIAHGNATRPAPEPDRWRASATPAATTCRASTKSSASVSTARCRRSSSRRT